MQTKLLVWVLLVAASCLHVVAEELPPLDESTVLKLRDKRGIENIPVRRAVEHQLSQFRDRLSLNLKELIQKDDEATELLGPQKISIELAGKYRVADKEIVDYLVQNVTKTFVGPRMNVTTFETYPCAGALAGIGMPSIQGILRQCKNRAISSEEALCFAQVVSAVEGKVVGGYRLKTEAESATGVYSTNLSQILSILEF